MKSDSQNLFVSNHLFVCGKLMSEPSRPHVPLKVKMRMTCAVYMFMTMIGSCLRYEICPQSRKIICIICCPSSNPHTLIIQPHGKSQKTIILCWFHSSILASNNYLIQFTAVVGTRLCIMVTRHPLASKSMIMESGSSSLSGIYKAPNWVRVHHKSSMEWMT